jgi:hypothetical protein
LLETLTPGFSGHDTNWFGSALAFAGECLAVGAPGWFGVADASSAGGVFVYDTPTVGISSTLVQVLQHPSANIGDDFGWSVDGQSTSEAERFFIGAPGKQALGSNNDWNAGAAYVYERTNGENTFSLLHALQPVWVQQDDRFGEAVEHYGWFYFVGAPGWNNNEGAVYIFVKDQNTGDLSLLETISGSSTSCSSGFGMSIDYSGGYYGGHLVVGGSGGLGHASLYTVEIDALNWPAAPAVDVAPEMDLEPDDWTDVEGWGSDVSIDTLRIIVGGEGIAAFYRYDSGAPTLWSRLAMLDNQDWNSDIDDDLGMAVCVSGTLAWAGAPRSGEFDSGDGAVARWDVNGMPNCPADLDLNYTVDLDDLTTLLLNIGSSQSNVESGELNGDGAVNMLDLLLMLHAWGDCGA